MTATCRRLLLTSGGVTNASIRDALAGLPGKPVAGSGAMCIPTAMYGHPMAGPGVLELTALPGIDETALGAAGP